MRITKVVRDYIIRQAFGKDSIPRGLYELSEYARHHGPIVFDFHKDDGIITAVSKDFRFGSIITQGKDEQELDRNIKDAILTSFEIPSSFKREANIKRVGEQAKGYALA
ncbi:MAG: hypothetical protein Q8R08_04620 [bacterium]|nr:hypothetical protein [bacterium]